MKLESRPRDNENMFYNKTVDQKFCIEHTHSRKLLQTARAIKQKISIQKFSDNYKMKNFGNKKQTEKIKSPIIFNIYAICNALYPKTTNWVRQLASGTEGSNKVN